VPGGPLHEDIKLKAKTAISIEFDHHNLPDTSQIRTAFVRLWIVTEENTRV
jgi:hypothetical protein